MKPPDNTSPSSHLEMHPVSGRNIAALLNPRPVVIVGAYDTQVHFATVAWITPVSHDPALLAFSLRATSRTFQALKATRTFSINTLRKDHADFVHLCGNTSGHTHNKGEDIPHLLREHHPTKTKIPLIEGALSFLEGEVQSIQTVGDHELIIGSVSHALTHCLPDEQGLIEATDTLLCLQHHTLALARPL